ncbi:uncharacterized protein At1g01500-like isoform X2 [Phoenix dactylifera]|uniref:Uncharacterized protein At1g01500-like isoform X2 n=1 Tax=Phoenix dactylifera TaxID=42345 RepID=A0A8B8ZAW9_PHODC|nr:uncharacterized protein At1g01500-like isoform X2 [Phoenix dactylifera]
MESHHDPLSRESSQDSERKIIMHPLYLPKSSPWLDLKVFYVRASNFEVDESTPEHLTLNHIPLTPDTILEVNGRRSSIYSECVSSLLRRDRVDKKSEEATFVSTDNIRMTGSVRFEVFDGNNLLLAGVLELCNSSVLKGESKNHGKKWSMRCQSVMSVDNGFLKGKQYMSPEIPSPVLEVYVAGCFSGNPIILTKTLQLDCRRKQQKTVGLNSILEYETDEVKKEVPSEDALQALLLGTIISRSIDRTNDYFDWSYVLPTSKWISSTHDGTPTSVFVCLERWLLHYFKGAAEVVLIMSNRLAFWNN